MHVQSFMGSAGMTENGSCWHDGLVLTGVSLEREQVISLEVYECECECVSVCPCAAQTNSSMIAAYKQNQVTMQPRTILRCESCCFKYVTRCIVTCRGYLQGYLQVPLFSFASQLCSVSARPQ